MKKIKTLLVCALLSMAGSMMAQEDVVKLTCNDVIINPNETADLVVSLENSMEIVAWSFKLYLPENIDLAYEEEDGEKYYDTVTSLSSRENSRKHKVEITPTSDGGYLFTCYASPAAAIKENSGEIVTIQLMANTAFANHGIGTFKEVQVAEASSTQYNQDGSVEFFILDKETAVGIKEVETNSQNGVLYNLNGQRVVNAGKGLFIQNGKKIFKK